MGRQRQSVRQTRKVVTEEELYTPGFSMSFHAVADHAVLNVWALDLTRERGCCGFVIAFLVLLLRISTALRIGRG